MAEKCGSSTKKTDKILTGAVILTFGIYVGVAVGGVTAVIAGVSEKELFREPLSLVTGIIAGLIAMECFIRFVRSNP